MYQIITPDTASIQYELLDADVYKANLSNREYAILPEEKSDFRRKPAYSFKDGKVLHEYYPGEFAHLYETEEEYLKALRGETYFDCSLFYDKEMNVYAGFELLPRITPKFYNRPHKIDEHYVDPDRTTMMPEKWSKAYFFDDGTVCYLMDRTKDFKQGWWFADKKNFDFFYQHVFR
jgi:hypothetical protein